MASVIPEYSEVRISNFALAQLGEPEINGLDDNTKASDLCRLWLDQSRDELLRQYDWNFASARATLSQLTAEPLFGYDYTYQLPADYLMLRDRENYGDYRIEDRTLLSNYDTDEFYIRYTRRITDYNDMDALFIEAWYMYLAYKIAYALTGDQQKTGVMLQLSRDALIRAKQIDDKEDQPDDEPESWSGMRGTGGTNYQCSIDESYRR